MNKTILQKLLTMQYQQHMTQLKKRIVEITFDI